MTVAVDAVVYFRIYNATMSITNVENANRSTRLLAQTTLRNVLGTKNLSDILGDRETISETMQVNKLSLYLHLNFNPVKGYPGCHALSRRCVGLWPTAKIGNLSKDVFEQRTSTGSEAFFLFICLDAIKFSLLTFFSLLKTIYPRVLTKPLPNDSKRSLPVDVHRSKMLLLKLPNSRCTREKPLVPRVVNGFTSVKESVN